MRYTHLPKNDRSQKAGRGRKHPIDPGLQMRYALIAQLFVPSVRQALLVAWRIKEFKAPKLN